MGTFIYNSKYLLGRQFNDPVVREQWTDWPYAVVKGEYNECQIRLHNGQCKSMAEIMSRLILDKKLQAEQWAGEKITKATLSVPYNATTIMYVTMLEAAAIAGIDCVRLVTEPIAAIMGTAIGEEFYKKFAKREHFSLVFDLSAERLAVSVVHVCNAIPTVKSYVEDRTIGGRFLDE